ncbi:hypothetical protein CAEBREN_28932 [Caenorhabditis brenneri]|uniref:Tyrosine-protein phosphatase domain-containing protein n=1 Tax=Caenorhabditis brenneri TaxID=135651 RepID=G0P0A3_CAEBE|nr:hypothetical protein CAEBREN_28932 [Caenorhabditis brenneri]
MKRTFIKVSLISIFLLTIGFNENIFIDALPLRTTSSEILHPAHKPPDTRPTGIDSGSNTRPINPSVSHDSLYSPDHPVLRTVPPIGYGSPNPPHLHDSFRVPHDQGYQETVDTHSPTSSQQSDEPSDHLTHSSMQHASDKSRVVRNEQNSEEFLNRFTSLTRLYNAISLQSELMNGTKTIEDAISQLLSIGSIKVADVIAYKQEDVTKLVDKMTELQGSFSISYYNFERAIGYANDIIKSHASIGNVNDFPSTEAYEKRLDEFYTALDKLALQRSIGLLEKFRDEASNLISLDLTSPGVDKYGAVSSYRSLKERVKNFEYGLETLKTEISTWKAYLDLADRDSHKVLRPFEYVYRTFEVLQRYKKWKEDIKSEPLSDTKTRFSKVTELFKIFKTAKTSSDLMINLIKFRILFEKQGILKGVSGLELLPHVFQDDWFVKTLAHKGREHQIFDGLSPIMKLINKLSTVDSHLRQLSNTDFLNSFQLFKSIHNLLMKLPEGFETSVDLVTDFNTCFEKTNLTDQHNSLEASVEKGYKLQKGLAILKKSKFLEMDMDKILEELNTFWSSVSFTDITKDTESIDELEDVHTKLMSSGKLNEVFSYIESILNSMKGFDVEYVRGYLLDATNVKERFDDLMKRGDTFDTFSALDCMKDLQTKSETASGAAEIVLSLEKFKSNHLDSAKTGSLAISQASSKLKNLHIDSLIENMKKDASNHTESLNKMSSYSSKTGTGSEILAVSASILRGSYELLKLESSLNNLAIDVDNVLNNYAENTADKIFIEDQWGDHMKDLMNLDTGIESIRKFHDSINIGNASTFGDYGAALEKVKLGDMSFHMKEKSEALEKCLTFSLDDTKKSKHVLAKKTIDKIAAMDLSFASHKAQFEGAQGVLDHLQTFLTQFLDQIESKEAREEGGQISTTVIIIIGAVAFLVLIGMIVLVYMGCTHKGCFKTLIKESHSTEYKYIRNGQIVPKSQQCIWLNNLTYFRPQDAYNTHANYVTTMKIADNNFFISTANSIPERKHALPETIKFKNRNLMATRGYHGNKIVTRTGTIFYAVQAPMAADATHDDTQEDFWDLTWNDGAEFIIMLNRIFDGLDGPNGVRYTNLARYFPTADREGPGRTITIGKYTLTEITSTNENYDDDRLHRDFTVRVIEITRTVGGRFSRRSETRRITHYQHNHWEEDGVPRNGFQAMYDVMRVVRQSKKPIIVHCNTGTDRTMAFIGMEYIPRLIEVDTEQNYITLFTKLAEHRYGAFGTVRISYTLQLGVIFFMVMDLDLFVTFEPHRTMYERVVTNQEGVPREGRRGNVVF